MKVNILPSEDNDYISERAISILEFNKNRLNKVEIEHDERTAVFDTHLVAWLATLKEVITAQPGVHIKKRVDLSGETVYISKINQDTILIKLYDEISRSYVEFYFHGDDIVEILGHAVAYMKTKLQELSIKADSLKDFEAICA